MNASEKHSPKQSADPVYRHAVKEAFAASMALLVAAVYCVGYSYWFGYGIDAENLQVVLGFPSWVFWGVMVPWAAAVVFSLWFGLVFIQDEEFEEEPEEPPL